MSRESDCPTSVSDDLVMAIREAAVLWHHASGATTCYAAGEPLTEAMRVVRHSAIDRFTSAVAAYGQRCWDRGYAARQAEDRTKSEANADAANEWWRQQDEEISRTGAAIDAALDEVTSQLGRAN